MKYGLTEAQWNGLPEYLRRTLDALNELYPYRCGSPFWTSTPENDFCQWISLGESMGLLTMAEWYGIYRSLGW